MLERKLALAFGFVVGLAVDLSDLPEHAVCGANWYLTAPRRRPIPVT